MYNVAIDNTHDGSPYRGAESNWSTKVVLDPSTKTVRISNWWGNGQPFEEFLQKEITLGRCKGAHFANLSALETALQQPSAQDMLAALCDGHSLEWDGQNTVGRLTPEAKEAQAYLEELIEALWEECPNFLQAHEWFHGKRPEECLTAVEEVEEAALHGFFLDLQDVQNYLSEEVCR